MKENLRTPRTENLLTKAMLTRSMTRTPPGPRQLSGISTVCNVIENSRAYIRDIGILVVNKYNKYFFKLF